MHVYTYYAVKPKIIVSDFSLILVITVFFSFHCSRTFSIIDLTYLKKNPPITASKPDNRIIKR